MVEIYAPISTDISTLINLVLYTKGTSFVTF